jgi:hypothetical protein
LAFGWPGTGRFSSPWLFPAAQETHLGRDHLDGGARVAVFVFVLADLEAAFYIHAILCGGLIYGQKCGTSATTQARDSLLNIIRF